jgi:tRNA nucleotidyltransferase/poly(A) polymerase
MMRVPRRAAVPLYRAPTTIQRGKMSASVVVDPATWGRILDDLDIILTRHRGAGWIVGGSVRDVLLGQPVHDVDVVVTVDPALVAEAVASDSGNRRAVVPLAHGAGTRRVVLGGPAEAPIAQLDISALNGPTLEADLADRDFTVNAMALLLSARDVFVYCLGETRSHVQTASPAALPHLVDPLGGLSDLGARRLRVTTAHALRDDPLRILRAARFAVQLDLTVEPGTRQLAREAAPELADVATERVGEEMRQLLAHPRAAQGLTLLRECGAVALLIPELEGDGAAETHALMALAALERTPALLSATETEARIAPFSAALMAWLAHPLSGNRPRLQALRWAALLH